MATGIGDLVVNLTANNKRFNSGMRSSQGSVSRFRGAIGQLGVKLAAFSAIATGVAAGAMAIMVKGQLKSIDATAKLSDRVGVSTEFISSMGFAAEQTGASQEVFNKAIGDFSKRIGQATQGLSTQKRALELLGLTSEDVSKIPLEEAFGLVAGKLGQLEDQTLKTAVASDLFGRSGTKLINLFDEGGGGLAKFRAEADRLGITFSRLDAAKVEEANDAMNRIKRATTGVVTQLTIAMAPAIESIANTMTQHVLPVFDDFGGKIAAVGFAFANFGTSAKIALLEIVSQGLTAFPQLEEPIAQFAGFFVGVFSGLKTFFGLWLDTIFAGFTELKNIAEAVVSGISAAFTSIKSGDIAGAGGAFGDAFIDTLANQENVKDPKIIDSSIKAFSEARKEFEDKLTKSGGLTSFVDSEIGRLNKELSQRADAFQEDRSAAAIDKKSGVGGAVGAGVTPAKLTQGALRGSKEAFDKVLKFGLGGKKDTEQQKQTKAAETAAGELKEINEKLEGGELVLGAFS